MTNFIDQRGSVLSLVNLERRIVHKHTLLVLTSLRHRELLIFLKPPKMPDTIALNEQVPISA